MRCFVITKKHIIISISAIVLIISGIILSKIESSPTAQPTFKENSPEEIVFDVLPTKSSSSVIQGAKEYLSSASKPKPIEVLTSFGGIFSETYSPDDYHESSEIPKSVTQENTNLNTVEEMTNNSSELLKNETPYLITEQGLADGGFNISDNAQILIIHTHTTESYTPESSSGLPDNSRSTDETRNMISVGDVFKQKLTEMGFKVIHDKTVHDYPSYQGAYGRSLTTAKKHLDDNSNIQIILDIHRDAITKEDGTRVKLVKDVNGTSCAQMMIVCGTDSGGLSHPNWQSNLKFAACIQHKMQKLYPGVMRPINLREERFNQHLTPAALILEIGTHGNTITEAKNGAVLLAEAIGSVLKS